MVKRLGAGMALSFFAVLAAVLFSDAARAAGDWEWTQDQGWIQGAGVSRPTAKEQLAHAYQLEQRGEFMDAARQYFLLIQNFPDSEESGVGLQRLAKCLFEMENFYTSYQAIEQVIKTYPNTGRMSDLIEIELRIAKKMLMSNASTTVFSQETNARQTNIRRALEVVDQVLEHDPWGPVAAEAYMVKGEAHLYMGEIAAARSAFERVQNDFPRSQHVERARLGVLRCDSLVGQASPRELQDQVEVLREMEAERSRESDPAATDEFDSLDQSINQLAEIEAGKMMEQAAQYKRMGTRNGVKAADFLYKEIMRRYPHSSQAGEAREIVAGIRIPEEEGRVAKALRNINWNPFNWNKEPEPPWITPHLSPEDQVMVDAGLGPIAGAPETAFPFESGSAGVRPAAFDDPSFAARHDADLASLPPSGDARPMMEGSPGANGLENGFQGLPAGYAYPEPGYPSMPPPATYPQPTYRPPASNPLPSISDADLVGVSGSQIPPPQMQPSSPPPSAAAPAPGYGGYQDPYAMAAPLPDMGPVGRSSGSEPPRLGVLPNADMSDLVGPSRRLESVQAPQPYGLDPAPAGQTYYQPPASANAYAPVDAYAAPHQAQGGWTMDAELW